MPWWKYTSLSNITPSDMKEKKDSTASPPTLNRSTFLGTELLKHLTPISAKILEMAPWTSNVSNCLYTPNKLLLQPQKVAFIAHFLPSLLTSSSFLNKSTSKPLPSRLPIKTLQVHLKIPTTPHTSNPPQLHHPLQHPQVTQTDTMKYPHPLTLSQVPPHPLSLLFRTNSRRHHRLPCHPPPFINLTFPKISLPILDH